MLLSLSLSRIPGSATDPIIDSTREDMVKNGDLGVSVPDYTDLNVSTKVVKIIQSYTSVVDRMVWRKY